MRKQHIRHSMSSFRQILIRRFFLSILIILLFGLFGCHQADRDDLQWSLHSENGSSLMNVQLNRRILSRYTDEKLQHYLMQTSSFSSDLSISYHRQNVVLHRECRYDRWNERFIIEDYFDSVDPVRSFHLFDDFLSAMLIFDNIPLQDVAEGQSAQIKYTVSLMSFPPPINLLMFNRYKIRVNKKIKFIFGEAAA